MQDYENDRTRVLMYVPITISRTTVVCAPLYRRNMDHGHVHGSRTRQTILAGDATASTVAIS